MTSPGTASDSRWQVLAGLRFVLAMVIVAAHLRWFAPADQPWIFLASLGGTSAVLGFLVISGYSIAHSLERRPIGFYRRRVLRIYPLYATAVLFALLPFSSGIQAFRVPDNIFVRPHLVTVIGNLLMLQNVVCRPVSSNILVWTLGIEVACYLLAPQFRKMGTPYLLVLLAISAAAFGFYPRMGLPHYAVLLWGFPLLFFAWAWIAGFILQRYRTAIWLGVMFAGLCVGMVSINTSFNSRYSIPTAGVSVLVVTCAPYVRLPRWAGSVLNYLGDFSYPIYLFHLPTFLLGAGVMNMSSATGLIIAAFLISAAFLLMDSILRPIFARSRDRSNLPTPA